MAGAGPVGLPAWPDPVWAARGDELRVASPVRRLGLAASLVRDVRVLPVLDVAPDGSDEGRLVRRVVSGCDPFPWPRRWARPVLDLPEHLESYLSGRSRRALRTNLHRARSTLQVRTVDDRAGLLDAYDRHRPGLREWLSTHDSGAREQWLAVEAEGAGPVGLAVFTLAGRHAVLRSLTSSLLDERASAGRYLLHTEVCAAAVAHGVQTLLIEGPSAVFTSVGLQHFQRVLGYRVVNVQLAGRHSRPGRQPAAVAEVAEVASEETGGVGEPAALRPRA